MTADFAPLILVAAWFAFLGYLAITPRDKLQMGWLLMVAALLAAPVLAIFFPFLR